MILLATLALVYLGALKVPLLCLESNVEPIGVVISDHLINYAVIINGAKFDKGP